MSRSAETRRFYRFDEALTLGGVSSRYADVARSEAWLRHRLAEVWATEGRADQPRAPTLRVARSAPWSYCRGRSEIVLLPRQACLAVLLHEVAHALGHTTHGRGFTRRYLGLLVRYGRCEAGRLALAAGLCGVRA